MFLLNYVAIAGRNLTVDNLKQKLEPYIIDTESQLRESLHEIIGCSPNILDKGVVKSEHKKVLDANVGEHVFIFIIDAQAHDDETYDCNEIVITSENRKDFYGDILAKMKLKLPGVQKGINYVKKTIFIGEAIVINYEEFFNFRFKEYYNENTNLIDDNKKHSFGMMVGRCAYDDERCTSSIITNTLNKDPPKFDLPISPPVWTFTGHVKDPSNNGDDDSMFRHIYNVYTKTTSNTSVICTLKEKNKASYIEDAVNKKPIVSVCGESLLCSGSIFNFPSVIK
nr:2589_t:CDS:2 [Entrophospora candida]